MGTENCFKNPDSGPARADHGEVVGEVDGSGKLSGVDEEGGCVVRGLKFVLYGKNITF
jgi:hypothetical protein